MNISRRTFLGGADAMAAAGRATKAPLARFVAPGFNLKGIDLFAEALKA